MNKKYIVIGVALAVVVGLFFFIKPSMGNDMQYFEKEILPLMQERESMEENINTMAEDISDPPYTKAELAIIREFYKEQNRSYDILKKIDKKTKGKKLKELRPALDEYIYYGYKHYDLMLPYVKEAMDAAEKNDIKLLEKLFSKYPSEAIEYKSFSISAGHGVVHKYKQNK